MDLDDFQFDEASFKSKKENRRSEPSLKVQNTELETKRENNFKRKKNYKSAYFQIFDPSSNLWVLVNSDILESENHDKSKKTFL